MKKLWHILAVCLALGATTVRSDVADVDAMLIYASNDSAPLDYKLDAVVPKLRSVLKFQSYELLGTGSGAIHVPGAISIDLGKGHSLDIKVAGDKGDRFKLDVNWMQDGKILVSTRAGVSRKSPLVLGGVPYKNGKLVVTLIAK